MNPHAPPQTSPVALLRTFWKYRELTIQMTKRDVLGKYKGSIIGIAWSFFNPVVMLIVYTFVFSVIFKARWGTAGDESKPAFAVILFTGLIFYSFFVEIITRAPSIVLANVNYVKKVVFPLEILPLIAIGTALFHGLVSLFVLFVAFYVLHGYINWTAFLIPFILLPLCLVSIGFGWFLASAGVFFRDIGQFMVIAASLLMFLTPIFYPMAAIPEKYHVFILANPLTFLVEQARQVVIMGEYPSWLGLCIYTSFSACIAWAGFWFFQKTRRGFADVL